MGLSRTHIITHFLLPSFSIRTSAMQLVVLFTILFFFSAALAQSTIFEFNVEDAEGETVSLSKYSEKKVIIVVNVASNCGYTYTNYKGLVDLYAKYKQHGLEILAFPSNQFGEQEPGTDEGKWLAFPILLLISSFSSSSSLHFCGSFLSYPCLHI